MCFPIWNFEDYYSAFAFHLQGVGFLSICMGITFPIMSLLIVLPQKKENIRWKIKEVFYDVSA